MGILDTLFGKDDTPQPQDQRQTASNADQSTDEAAIERYRYMLKTAPPETIEQAHAEAFAKLTSEQRQEVLQQLQENLPEAERERLAQNADDPQALAQAATRAEIRQPGTMERAFGGAGGMGFGGMLAGGLLSSIAGTVIGSYIAQQFFSNDANSSSNQEGNSGDPDQNESASTDESNLDATGAAEASTPDASDDFAGDFGGDIGGDF